MAIFASASRSHVHSKGLPRGCEHYTCCQLRWTVAAAAYPPALKRASVMSDAGYTHRVLLSANRTAAGAAAVAGACVAPQPSP